MVHVLGSRGSEQTVRGHEAMFRLCPAPCGTQRLGAGPVVTVRVCRPLSYLCLTMGA